MNWEIILTAAVGFLGGSITPLALHFLNRRNLTNQTNADVMNKIATGGQAAVSAAVQMLNELQEENARLRLDLSGLRTDLYNLQVGEQEKQLKLNEVIDALKAYIKVLIDTLREHGIKDIPPRPDILKESDPKIPRMK